jgi:hypothetical protein
VKEREAERADRPEPPGNGAMDAMLERLDEALGRLPEIYRCRSIRCPARREEGVGKQPQLEFTVNRYQDEDFLIREES